MQPKKIITLLLVVAMTLICGVTSVSAQDNTSALAMAVEVDSSAALAKEPCDIQPGDTVDVSVTITANPGLRLLKFAVVYDTAALTLKTNTDGTVAYTSDKAFDALTESVVESEKTDGKIVYTATAANDVTATGTVLKLTFTVKEAFHGDTGVVLTDYVKNAMGVKENVYTTYTPDVSDASVEGYKKATATVHKYGAPVVAEPNCVEAGSKTYTCTVTGCTHSLVLANGDAKEHTYVDMAEKAPTCTETGLTGGKICSVCGDVQSEQTEVPATGHTMGEWVVDKEATLEAPGSKTQKCVHCDYSVTEEIPQLVEEDSGNGGLIIIIVVIVLVVIIAGVCLYLFVFKKKQ